MRKRSFRLFTVGASLGLLVMAMSASPLRADTFSIVSATWNTVGAATGLGDPGFYTYNPAEVAGLTWSSTQKITPYCVTYGCTGLWAYDPGQPAGIQEVSIAPADDGLSGFFATTFNLSPGYTNASITGTVSIDDQGCVFLNGNNLGCQSFGIETGQYSINFSSINPSYFVTGTNYLVISDDNTGAGPSGVEYNAAITFDAAEPSSLLLLFSGMAALALLVRRKAVGRA